MSSFENIKPIETYTDDANIPFVDYEHFESSPNQRHEAKRRFIDNETYGITARYPKLDTLYDTVEGQEDLQAKKYRTYEAMYELAARENDTEITPEIARLYRMSHISRLKKILLVEASRRVFYPGNSTEEQVAREEYAALNREIFGEMDEVMFDGIMHTEQERLAAFVPGNELSREISGYLRSYFDTHRYEVLEMPLMDESTMTKLREVTLNRYADVLAAVPETDDITYYDAEECQEIMQRALNAGGLDEKGWTVVIDPAKLVTSASTDSKKIILTKSTRRNASQLRRLIIHEQVVHAYRGQNGEDSGVTVLKTGTPEYADVEEGLGVLLECALAESMDNASFHRARDRYITAGLALGTDGEPRDGRQVFELLWRILALRRANAEGSIVSNDVEMAKKSAMQHVENAFRSTTYDKPGVIYAKLKIYLEGLKKNADYFSEHLDELDSVLDNAMLGKFDHTNPEESRLVEAAIQQSLTSRQ